VNISEAYRFTSLDGCVPPATLEDVALQLSTLIEDADIEAAHRVADDLLQKALQIAVTAEDTADMGAHVAEIIAHFNNLKKLYS